MGEIVRARVELTAEDGATIGAYRVRPARPARGGLVVVQEIFGVNSHIRSVADGYAAQGYEVIAPMFFDRIQPETEFAYDEAGIAEGRAMAMQLGMETPLLDVAAAIEQLEQPGKCGIVGYCWGGSLTYRAATRVPGLSAAVGYYGSLVAKFAGDPPKVPVLLHFGEHDKGIPLADVAKIRAQRPEVEVHLYDAGHGFNCDQRASYEATSAALARERTLAFFARHLG